LARLRSKLSRKRARAITSAEIQYVVCRENSGYPASLDLRKIYRRLPDPRAEADGFLRVFDESGENYLYPSRFLVSVSLPEAVAEEFATAG
jgi:hypothetical protein